MLEVKLGIYQHYKGGRYEVIGVGQMEAAGEAVVVYKSLQDRGDFPAGSLWTRPLKNFVELVMVDGKKIPRFLRHSPDTTKFTAHDLVRLALYPYLVYLLNVALISLFPYAVEVYRLDIPLHLLGGLSIAASVSYLLRWLEANGRVIIRQRFYQAFLIVAMVTLAAVLWEWYEFLHDHFFGSRYQPSKADTMKDLAIGMLGGALYCVSLLKKKSA